MLPDFGAVGGLVNLIGLAVVGAVVFWLRGLPELLFGWARQFLVTTMTIDTRDEFLFAALVEHMNTQQALRNINQFTARTVRGGTAYQSLEEELRMGMKPRAFLSPGEGLHFFRLDGRLIWMRREVQMGMALIERISLSHLGRNRRPLQQFLDDAIAARVAREVDKVAVYVPNPFHGGDWVRTRLGNNRPLKSVVLAAGQAEAILGDVQGFMASHARYTDLGVPWRRGYLLYGPPGTGKTSLVTALASELHLNVCALSLASPVVSDEKIYALLAGIPARSLLLIEDVDAFFDQRRQASEQVKLSFSGFLNALDGVASQEGTILFMTSNHPERLDPALVRAGRIDRQFELGYCDEDQLRRLFLKFFPNPEAAERFARSQIGRTLSAATVQSRLLAAKSADEAIASFATQQP